MVEAVRPDPVDDPGEEASEGRQGLTLGTAVVWLSPGVPRSVAPSGIPEPTTGPVPETVPPAPDIDAAPEVLLFEALEPQLFDSVDPPPSNAEFELVLGQGMISGLTPGVLISVAPSGMPPRPDEFELSEELSADGAPSGEVGPIPGVVVVCACAAANAIQQPMAASSKNGYRIERPQLIADVSLTRPGKVESARAQPLRESGCRRSFCKHACAELVPSRSTGFVPLQRLTLGGRADFVPIYEHFDRGDAMTHRKLTKISCFRHRTK
jgi:hypothetical protein